MSASSYSKVIANICNKISNNVYVTPEWLENNFDTILSDRYSVTYNASRREAFFIDSLTDTTVFCRGMEDHGFVAVEEVVEVTNRQKGCYNRITINRFDAELIVDIFSTKRGKTTQVCGMLANSYRILPFGGYMFLVASEK